jgi:hypothetical protein
MAAKQIKMADKELREEVETYLDLNPEAPSAKIGVSVSNGVITLSGYVRIAAPGRDCGSFGCRAVDASRGKRRGGGDANSWGITQMF